MSQEKKVKEEEKEEEEKEVAEAANKGEDTYSLTHTRKHTNQLLPSRMPTLKIISTVNKPCCLSFCL